MKQYTLDLIFNDSLPSIKKGNKNFCPLEKAAIKYLKDISGTLSLYLEKQHQKYHPDKPKTFHISAEASLKVGISFDINHDLDIEADFKNFVLSFIDLISNANINLESDQDFPYSEVIFYLYRKAGRKIKKPVDVFLDGILIGSIEGNFSDVILAPKPPKEYKINARISNLNRDKRRLEPKGVDGQKFSPIAFDVEKNFKSLCVEYAEQTLLTMSVIEEYDSKGEAKSTLKSFEKTHTKSK